jgi:CHASE3 domain sensor protein
MRFTIKAKLILTFGLLIAAIGVLVALSLNHLSSLNAATHDVISGPAAQLSRAQTIEAPISAEIHQRALRRDRAGATSLMLNDARVSLSAMEKAAQAIVSIDKAKMAQTDEEAKAVFDEARISLISVAIIALLCAMRSSACAAWSRTTRS